MLNLNEFSHNHHPGSENVGKIYQTWNSGHILS
jgi:hypothetical protein